eukprot:PhF_6_TR11740/c0_g2_i1/m.19189
MFAARIVPYLCLMIAVMAMSCGGVWFALIPDAPTVRKAAWRLAITSLFQSPCFVYQLYHLDDDGRRRYVREGLVKLVFAGVVLGVHFATWSYSVSHTSLTQALLLISTTPLFIVVERTAKATWEWYRKPTPSRKTKQSAALGDREVTTEDAQDVAEDTTDQHATPKHLFPTPMEFSGTALGFTTAAVLVLFGQHGHGGDHNATFSGGISAVFGAVAFWLYLDVGREVRQWMPLFLYATPVTALGALCCFVASITVMGEDTSANLFDHPRWILFSVIAASTSGMLGHTLCNYALQKVNSLIVSVACLMEPILGSFIGWLAGVQDVPGWLTLALGPVLLVALCLLIFGERSKQQQDPSSDSKLNGVGKNHLNDDEEIHFPDQMMA